MKHFYRAETQNPKAVKVPEVTSQPQSKERVLLILVATIKNVILPHDHREYRNTIKLSTSLTHTAWFARDKDLCAKSRELGN